MKKLLLTILFFICLATNTAYSQAFRTTWITTDTQITIPTNDSLEYNYDISWKNLTNKGVGDGSEKNQKGSYTIKNLENGSIYEIAITGDFPHFYMKRNQTESSKLQTIEEWGKIKWQSMEYAFSGCENLTYEATDIPNLQDVTDMSDMFRGCKKFDGNSSINNWNTENIIDMGWMFDKASLFNQNIESWNTKKVIKMMYMFNDAISFNQPIGNWNTENVKYMNGMFGNATSFNQPIGEWNTENVKNMSAMFYDAVSFNQPIGEWNTKNTEDMGLMFSGAVSFNQPIGEWNTENIKDMSFMFSGNTTFNQPIENWNTKNVTEMKHMFRGATSFNKPLERWNTQNVTDMSEMFKDATSFNHPLGKWNLSNMKPYEGEKPKIGVFVIIRGRSMSEMLDSCGMSKENYDTTLLGWYKSKNTPKNITLGASRLMFCKSKKIRQKLISKYGWEIEGDELECQD